jgi:tRNA-binding EMAP/Myf-like protein
MIVVCRLLEILPHENADSLFVTQCEVGADRPLQVVTNLSELQVGEVMPLALVGHTMPVGHAVPHIKLAKLRGVTSEGMFVTWAELHETELHLNAPEAYEVGAVLVANPVVVDAEVPAGSFKKVTEILNAFELDLEAFVGRDVVVMEKMDGSSHRVGYRQGLTWCGGHNRMHAVGATATDDGFGFGMFVKGTGIAMRVTEYCEQNGIIDLAVYGEFCGPKIQENFYQLDALAFYVFDIAIGEVWQDWDRVVAIAQELKLSVVPVDHLGPFDLDKINAVVDQRSQFGEDTPREGVVVKFRQEGVFADGSRAIFKHKPEKRQERKSHRGALVLSAEELAFQSLRDAIADYVTGERAEHVVGHLQEAGTTIDFPTVVREMQLDILKEADPLHRTQFAAEAKDFRKIVGKLVGKSGECKRAIFAAIKAK